MKITWTKLIYSIAIFIFMIFVILDCYNVYVYYNPNEVVTFKLYDYIEHPNRTNSNYYIGIYSGDLNSEHLQIEAYKYYFNTDEIPTEMQVYIRYIFGKPITVSGDLNFGSIASNLVIKFMVITIIAMMIIKIFIERK